MNGLTVVALIVFVAVIAGFLHARARRREQLRRSAEREHRWVIEGDPRGTYGPNYRTPGATVIRPDSAMLHLEDGAVTTTKLEAAAIKVQPLKPVYHPEPRKPDPDIRIHVEVEWGGDAD